MPWHPCVNSRDTITTEEGYALNTYEIDDHQNFDSEPTTGSPWKVTSHCRDANGTWVGMINQFAGFDRRDTGDEILDTSGIANTSFAQVVYFADDGTPAQAFDLPVGAAYLWSGAGRYSFLSSDAAKCAIRSVLPGKYFAPNIESELLAWSSGALDLAVRTDGVNVWAVLLSQQSVRYPWLSRVRRFDKCGVDHDEIAVLYEGDGEDSFHDTTFAGDNHEDTWWQQTNVKPGDQDDAGIENSFRWQPARLDVFGGGLGGFNKIDVIPATFRNDGPKGVVGHVEACASPAEPGVLHVMWAEGGFWRGLTGTTPTVSWDGNSGQNGQRINYSRWSPSALLLSNDIAFEDGSSTIGGHEPTTFPGVWVFTDEYILRNDHGSCTAFIWSWAFDGTCEESGPLHLDPNQFAYFDMSSGGASFVQLFSTNLIPMPAEAGFDPVLPVGSFDAHSSISIFNVSAPHRNIYASSLYTDPTLADLDVYLIGVNFSSNGAPPGGLSAFYRIPVDGSDTFTFLDGVRLMQFSIVNVGSAPLVAASDFVSDPGNIWIPVGGTGGGNVWHLTRTCERTWELLTAFPASPLPGAGIDLAGGWADGIEVEARNSPPSIVTDDSGNDWLAAGGVQPPGQFSGIFPFYAAALRARICRCCVPCIQRIGLHIWEQH
jgi:hypothetical protein